ncbi:MAG: hypothetical protein K8R74_08715 [Bacteroidales bacterium]|nr:hypothetical protein [Bacteroidales bacterium]
MRTVFTIILILIISISNCQVIELELVEDLYGPYHTTQEKLNDSIEKIAAISDTSGIIYQTKYFLNGYPDSIWTIFYPANGLRQEFQFSKNLCKRWTNYSNDLKVYELLSTEGLPIIILDNLSSIYGRSFLDYKLAKLFKNDFKKVDADDYQVTSYGKILISNDLKEDIIQLITEQKLTLTFNYFYDSGNLSQIIKYSNGYKISMTQHYYKNSECNRKEFYKGDKLIKTQTFKDGQLKKEKLH